MHIIAIYDIGEKRVGKVLKVFRKYLTWIQNSVFEGEITISKLESLKSELKKIIKQDEDQVLFYKLRTDKYLNRDVLGKEYNPFDTII